MNEEYLWDGSGPPDREIAQLEQMLGQLRSAPPKRKRHWRALAAAAALLVALGGSLLLRRGELTSWHLSIGGHQTTQVRSGQTIETGSTTRATIASESVGEIQVEPCSKLRLTKAGKTEQQFVLEHGTIHAFIWAPPTQFVVDTPTAKTVDLGCQYTLDVAPDGAGILTVTMGWVAFQSGSFESFIPAGAQCRTRPGRGPGTPYRKDAAPSFKDALDRFDNTGDAAALDTVVVAARAQDGLTLWHLLSRTQGEQRAKVFAAFSDKIKLPANVTQQAIMRGDPQSMDTAWNSMQLGDTSWWRIWKQAKAPGQLATDSSTRSR